MLEGLLGISFGLLVPKRDGEPLGCWPVANLVGRRASLAGVSRSGLDVICFIS